MWWHALVRTTKNFGETSSCSVDDPVTLCSMTVSCNSNLPNHINNHYHFFIRKYNNLLFSVFSKPHAHNKACIVKNQLRTSTDAVAFYLCAKPQPVGLSISVYCAKKTKSGYI